MKLCVCISNVEIAWLISAQKSDNKRKSPIKYHRVQCRYQSIPLSFPPPSSPPSSSSSSSSSTLLPPLQPRPQVAMSAPTKAKRVGLPTKKRQRDNPIL